VNREDIIEIHFISPIENVASILDRGILSNRRAARFAHRSVAMEEVQDRRRDKRIPGAGLLHDYANLYFDAHNPMLSKRRDQNDAICVLRIDHIVLDLQGVIVTDCNAASDYARFYAASAGIWALDKDLVFAQFWTNADDPYEVMRHKSIKCAEVLVPDSVNPDLLVGAYVANQRALRAFEALGTRLPVITNSAMFF
jgi:ssDNA thymidine ADP-ribosyltransferase, DarT